MAYVVVTGLPGSGKSSVARPLARGLRLPLLSKDVVKEAIAAVEAGSTVTRERSGQLSAAALEVVFAVAADAGGAVLEASWDPDRARERLLELPGSLIEVHCSCSPDLARSRYVDRADRRHPAHLDHLRFDDADLWSVGREGPLGLSDPVLGVDCTVSVDIAQLADEVRRHPVWG